MHSGYDTGIKHYQDELALQYLPAVKAMAYRLKERLPSSIDINDLNSIGTEELIKLARRYDPEINDSFWGYAKTRVYGSMLDYLRSLDIVSRANRKLIKQIQEIENRFLCTQGYEPSDEELANECDESLEKINEARRAATIYNVMPIDDLVVDQGSDVDNEVLKNEIMRKIKKELKKLSKREQTVIQLYYFEELSYKEIAEILDITPSRISQIHKKVVSTIKTQVE
jgi:RNA polymerase sigma factor for flagellar operon FliA